MPPAARVTDLTSHGTPLNPGPGSPTVLIGFMPAWRALPSSVASAVESVSNAAKQFMQTPVLTPANAAPKIAQITSGLGQAAGARGQQPEALQACSVRPRLTSISSIPSRGSRARTRTACGSSTSPVTMFKQSMRPWIRKM